MAECVQDGNAFYILAYAFYSIDVRFCTENVGFCRERRVLLQGSGGYVF